MTVIFTLWLEIENPTPSIICELTNIPAKFQCDPIWNDGFWRGRSNKKKNNKMNNNMISDMRSVSDLKIITSYVWT